MTRAPVTIELARAALANIPADLNRDEWARIGMAIKSEFPDEDGFALFEEWSATAADHNPQDTRATWRSIRAAGGVTIATMLHEAKRHGFRFEEGAREQRPAPARPDGRARAQADEQQHAADQERAAGQASRDWEAAAAAGEHPYLVSKGVGSHGLRVGADGWLLVPVRDETGRLHNVQRIAPAAVKGKWQKLFLRNGKKSGLWHMLGEPAAGAPLLIAEGYATAATLHEATSYPVAVAFDAGNLQRVARTLRALFPDARLVVCGDDDSGTAARTGRNPGREKAAAAARAAHGMDAYPEPLPAGGSDFNDMYQAIGGATGLAAVRSIVETALQMAASEQAHSEDQAPAPELQQSLDVFEISDEGVFYVGIEQDGKRKHPEWICSRLDVLALTRDQDGGGWGYLLQFADPLGNVKQWAMPARMLSGDGSEYRAALLGMGLRVDASPRARNLLTRYIQTRSPREFAQCTDRIGWHGTAFVLPRESIGDDAERIVFQTDAAIENTFKERGTLEQWRSRVGALCAGNSRLVFAVACAFAGPLLRPGGMESGGFHFRGDSSSGKTTVLKVAASVYGGAGYLQRWRTTDNALEAIAAQHSDVLLILDELAQVDPKTAGECAYMLANEQSKARSSRTSQPRPRLVWRLLFLSAGELGLADHMAEGMKRARSGQEVRMADIPVDAGGGLGAFEQLHGREGGALFARHITREALSCYGTAGRAFIEWACGNADTLSRRVREDLARMVGQLVPEGASGQVERVGARFALVGVAGELATAAGITGWQPGESERAARACFNAWLAARGGLGNGEVVTMLRSVRRFLEMHGEGRFTLWHRAADDHSPKTLQRAGVRRMLNADGEPIKSNSQHGVEFGDRISAMMGEGVSFEYFVLPEVFRTEIAAGFDFRTVAAVLRDHDCLESDKGELTIKTRLPGMGPARCYKITPRIFELDV